MNGLLLADTVVAVPPEAEIDAVVRRVHERMRGNDARFAVIARSNAATACRAAFPLVKTVLDRYPNEIRMVYHHYPLSYHRHALPAARAAECTGKQGRFWAMHDVLYRNQDSFDSISYGAFGDSAKVPDHRAYARCLRDTTIPPAVETGKRLARAVKLPGTPMFIVNGMYLPSFDTAYVIAAMKGRK